MTDDQNSQKMLVAWIVLIMRVQALLDLADVLTVPPAQTIP